MESETQRWPDRPGMDDATEFGSSSPSSGSSGRTSLADQLRQQASTRLSGQKDRAVDGLTSLADAVRQTGQQLRAADRAGVAGYVEGAADQAAQFAERLRTKDIGEIVADVERFARRQPAAFLGLSFGLGLIGARFLKSSRPRHTAARTGNDGPRSHFYEAGEDRSWSAARSSRPSTGTPDTTTYAPPRVSSDPAHSPETATRRSSAAVIDTPAPDTAGGSRSRGRRPRSEP